MSVSGLPERVIKHSSVRSSIRSRHSGEQIFHQVSSKPYNATVPAEKPSKPEQILSFPNQRGYQERSSTRYPSSQKLVLNGTVAVSQKVNGISDQYRPEPLRPHHRESFSQKQPASLPPQRASIAESPIKDAPPPLQPRQMRANQSMRVKGSHDRSHDHRHGLSMRCSPEKDNGRNSRVSST